MATGRLPTLDVWLRGLDLYQYRDRLHNLGVTTIEQLKEFGLDDSFLNDIGISQSAHRKKILENIPVAMHAGTLADIPASKMVSHKENIYENVPYNPSESAEKDDDIYENYTVATPIEEKSPKFSDSSEEGKLKKKPVPRPRLSKMSKEQKQQQQKTETLQSIPQSPPSDKSLSNMPKFQLAGVTLSESCPDDFDPFAIRKSLVLTAGLPKKYSDELLHVFNADTNSHKSAERPSCFPDNFGNGDISARSSDIYDAIWTDSSSSPSLKESPVLRKASDTSPFTPPFLPKPCSAENFDFEKDEPRENFENEASAYKQVEVTNESKTHFYVNDQFSNDESPPPPSFPPPGLPPEEESLPPVPPRTTSNSNNSFMYTKVIKPPNSSHNEILYSRQHVEKGTFSATKFKTLTSTSGPDPFNGEDPFQDETYQQECEHFNQPGASNIFNPHDQSMESAFDPFGIYDLQKETNDPLERVPPAPVWHETVQPTKASVDNMNNMYSLYSLAGPIQQDNSTDEGETSEGDISDPSSPEENQVGTSPAVDVISSSPYTRKAKQKSGYLWKQGGVKANRGWRKRWVVFDGKTLRYYPNHKSQISKRIVPVGCMERVEILVRDKDTDRFKFSLINRNRTFLFAAESLSDCTLWASTLMEAIITYNAERPKSEEQGGDMCSPDKMGYIKFERKGEMFVAIKNGKLCYYDSHADYKMASPLNEIDMKLASVKEVGKNRLQLSTHYAHFILLFNDKQDCVFWKMAMEDAIADGLGDNTVLDNVRENQSNHLCADCGAEEPHWASINLGIVLCKNCAGIHRDFDPRVSRVKSLRMDTTIWTPSLIEMMKAIGNQNSKRFWEKNLQPIHQINAETSPVQRKQFIQDKYVKNLWIDQHPLVSELNEELLRTVVKDDVLLTMRIIFSGADVLYKQKGTGKVAFDLAKEAGQRLQTEFLYHNGGDKTSRESATIDESMALRLRAEITLEGHLLKTGPKNRNAFMDRYCVIEHGCLRYFVNEKSSTARDSIENESMLCVQSVINIERYPNAFELSTTKANNRTYLFAATTPEEKMTWMKKLTMLFCPINLIKDIDDKDFSLAGNFFIKAGMASEWQRTFIFVDKKVVRYLNDEQEFLEIDLRKVSNLQYSDYAAGQPCSFATENGKCFTISIPGRSLYFQADLIRDTERLYEAFGNSMKGGGPTIEDQQLTTENVPVIVEKCIKFIEENGFNEDGIYRLAAQESRIQDLLSRFLADAHSLILKVDNNTVHEVANCLKRFFRQLKDPLFTKTGYQDWIKCAAKDSIESKLAFYKFQLNHLPQVNKCTVKKLVLHLASLSSHSKENRMDIKNIALAFGSTLMRGGAECIQQENLPLEMKVVEDLVTHHCVLFEEEVQRKNQTDNKLQEFHEKLKRAELQRRASELDLNQINEMKVTIYFQHKSNQSGDFTAVRGGTAGEAVEQMKRKFASSVGSQWVLYEVVYSDVLERPIHPSECLLDIVMSWSSWEEEYRKNTHLVLKSGDQVRQLDEVYDPKHALFAEFKYKEKKDKFRKFSFGFNQSKLSLFKDLGYNTPPSQSWQVEDMYIYFGADPKKNAQKFAFSFYVKGERMGKDLPLFGRTICCTTENERISWMAAMLKAKHPDGYLIS